MSRLLDKGGLTYYSNKIKSYLTNRFSKVETDISALDKKVDSDKKQLQNNIDTTKNTVLDNVKNIDDRISNVNYEMNEKYKELKTDVNSADFRPTGDTIKINNVEQMMFKDVKAGETIIIPHDEDNTDFLIECFAREELTTPLIHKVIDINPENEDLLEYDPRYVEITEEGARPRDSVTLKLTKEQEYNGYNVYVTDTLPQELVDSIENLTSYEVQ